MAGRKKKVEPAPDLISGSGDTGTNENKFSKEQLIASNRFRERRDILEALLKSGELYTVKIVEEKIESYMKGKVK
jgi:hypothetical protein